jgi:glutathione S-transferase
MRLHSYAASANCLKARLLLRLLEIPCEIVEVDIFAGATLTPEFAALNPVRETPVLELGDGTTVTQSNAVLSYLADGTPWAGTTRADRARVHAWFAFEQERVMAGIGEARFRLMTGRATREQLAGQLDTGQGALDVLEAHLAAHDWLVGDAPTAADLSVYAYTSVAPDAGLEHGPAVRAWLECLRALPRFHDDLVPYPDNARPGASRSIYD